MAIINIMIKAGNAWSMPAKSIFLTSFIINRPTIISAGAVAYSGTIATMGTNNSAIRQRRGPRAVTKR